MEKKKENGASTSAEEYGKILAEIDGAVEMVLSQDQENAEVRKDITSDDEAQREDAAALGEHASDAGDASSQSDDFNPGDAEIERGIKAGLSLKEIRAFKDKDSFDAVMSKLEAGKSPDENKTSKDRGNDEEGGEVDPAGDDIPTLPEDEGFDPKLVDAFKKMGAKLKQLSDENAALKKAGSTAQEQSFFDKQFGGLDEAVRSKVDDAGKAKLKQKFDMLEAGYKAVNAEVAREDVFREAAELALGDLMRATSAESKAALIEKRRSLHIAKPGEGNQSHGKGKSEEDVDREVARLISEKFDI